MACSVVAYPSHGERYLEMIFNIIIYYRKTLFLFKNAVNHWEFQPSQFIQSHELNHELNHELK